VSSGEGVSAEYGCYNPECPVVIAENDQIAAEVEEANQVPADPKLVDKATEVAKDVLAFERFKRDVRGQ
jgi:hypothetical protein